MTAQKAAALKGCGASQGILPNLAKVAPAAGISWFVFEETKRMMGMDPHS